MSEFDNSYGLYDGWITDNVDPLKLGRVRIVIPGLVEPETDWASPIGCPGGGSNSRGLWSIPEIGANVAVFFKEGELETPRYLTGPWSLPKDSTEAPTFTRNLTPAEAVQMTGLQTPRWEIVLDDRDGNEGLLIRDRKNPDNAIVFDGVQQTVSINGTVAVQITSTGIVNIDAMQVTINGRIVLPTSNPI